GRFRTNTVMTGAIWEFTPGTNTWLLKNAVLPVSRGYIPTLAVYDFKVGTYLIYTGGGSDWNGTTLVDTNDSFKYDPIADSIGTIASIPRATGETRAVPWAFPKLPQEMLVMGGGRTPPNPSDEVNVYFPFTNGWGTYDHFITARRNFATDSNGGCDGFFGYGHIWLAGGYGSDGTPLSSIEIYCNPRAAHANCNSNDATSKSDGDGNSHATAAITVSDNNRYANPTPMPRVTPTPRPRPSPAPRP